MKKFQKLVKENLQLITQTQNNLLSQIKQPESFKKEVPASEEAIVYTTCGALSVIASIDSYDFNKLTTSIANSFANCLILYARYADVNHETTMLCFELAAQIKSNTHYHNLRSA